MRHSCAQLAAAATLVLALVAAGPAGAATGNIATVAGTGTSGFNGDGIPATTAQLSFPTAVIAAPDGAFLIADQVNHRVRRVAADGTITTVAGSGTAGYTGNGGAATAARMNAPSGIAYLPDGSLLIADANNNAIRKVTPAGIMSTVVGSPVGAAGSTGDNGPATSALLAFPYDMATFADGSYVVVDQDNNRIRYVNAGGVITTFGATGGPGALNDPSGVTALADGSILIADTNNHRIRRATGDGQITTVAGTGTAGFTGDGGPAANARLSSPIRVVAQADGGYLIADRNNHRIRRVAPDGTISTLAGNGTAGGAGDGGPATSAQLNQPFGVAPFTDGDVLVADAFGHRIRRLDLGDPPPTPPPPPPPPPPPDVPPPPVERNITRPGISSTGVTFENPTYRCTDGIWVGLAANPQFEYQWIKVSQTVSSNSASVSITQVGTARAYTLKDSERGATFYCQVSALMGSGRRISAQSATKALSGREFIDTQLLSRAYGDVRVAGIDVFQTSQPSAGSQRFLPGNPIFPATCGGGTPTSFHPRLGTCTTPAVDASGPQRTTYVGVPLDGGQPATAVVYVNMLYGPASDRNQVVNVSLRGRIGGKLITSGGTPTAQISNPPQQRDATGVTVDERETDTAAGVVDSGVQIRIPNAWLQAAGATDERFDLEASLSLAPSSTATVQCEVVLFSGNDCYANDSYRLDNVGVWSDLAHLYISPLALLDSNQNQTRSSFQSPEDNSRRMREIFPGGRQMTIGPWRGEVDITGAAELTAKAEICEDAKLPVRDCRQQAIEVRIQDHLARERNAGGYDLIMGIHRYPTGNANGSIEPGWQPSRAELGMPFARFEVNDGSNNRPLTAVAHEFTHAMDILHADKVATDPLNGASCGGGVGGFGEDWPPQNTGRLQGVTFGRYDASGTRNSLVEIDRETAAGALYDLMSYCGDEGNSWLSPYNWTRIFNRLRDYKSKVGSRAAGRNMSPPTPGPMARATVTGQGYVVGTVTPNGVAIERIVPADPANEVPAADPGSPVQVTALGASGASVGTVGASISELRDADTPVSTFIAPLPAGAAAVTAASGPNTDRVERSKPPTIKLLAPRAGARVGGSAKAKLDVRWTAKDPDGDALTVTIDYAPDGKTFRPVYSGDSRGRVALSGDLLTASRRGRIRVTVSDGFNQARALSGAIVADGRPPSAAIVTPAKGDALDAGEQAVLAGQALDGAGRRLGGRSLTWFAGSRRLGTGEVLRAKLPAGSVRLRLEARVGGRVATASRTVRVKPVTLTLDRIAAAARVKPKVKTVAVTVQTSTAATLRIGGKSYAIGPKAKRLTVALPAKPATGALKLSYTITARGSKQKTLRGQLVVLRV